MKSFDQLLKNVEEVHELTSLTAKGAVNQMLTARNWAIGYYIVEFEQNGQDRAHYGSNLLSGLAKKLNIKGLDRQMRWMTKSLMAALCHYCRIRCSSLETTQRFDGKRKPQNALKCQSIVNEVWKNASLTG